MREHKLFSLSHRRNPESVFERQRKKNYSGKKSDDDKLFSLSQRRNLESGFRDTKEKIIPEKNAEHKLSS
jgi:hypothetical protein